MIFPHSAQRAHVLVACALAVFTLAACNQRPEWEKKVGFDLEQFNADGLYGPPDGLRAMSYEFCIPSRRDLSREVRSIDPTIQIHLNSPGRVGCGEGLYLCIGSTHQENFKEVLGQLAQLEYVERIERADFE